MPWKCVTGIPRAPFCIAGPWRYATIAPPAQIISLQYDIRSKHTRCVYHNAINALNYTILSFEFQSSFFVRRYYIAQKVHQEVLHDVCHL